MSTPVEQAAVERVAEAMWAATSNTDLVWHEIPVVVMNGYRDMARAAIEALQLTEEWGIKYDTFPNDVVLGREKNPDGSVTRVMKLDSEGHARQAVDSPAPIGGFHKSAVSRLVGPWRGQHEGARD